jgi:hypothetical protein
VGFFHSRCGSHTDISRSSIPGLLISDSLQERLPLMRKRLQVDMCYAVFDWNLSFCANDLRSTYKLPQNVYEQLKYFIPMICLTKPFQRKDSLQNYEDIGKYQSESRRLYVNWMRWLSAGSNYGIMSTELEIRFPYMQVILHFTILNIIFLPDK